MKIYKKHIILDKFEFDVAIDREITARAFEEFPDFTTYALSNSENKDDIVATAIKEKKLLQLFELNDEMGELVKFALPLMMKKAGEENAEEKAKEIFAFVDENEFTDEFSSKIFEIICLGFTRGTGEKKKVKFSMI